MEWTSSPPLEIDCKMILSYHDLIVLMKQGVIEGSNEKHVNGTSVDVHLGGEFLEEAQAELGLIHLDMAERQPLRTTKRKLGMGSGIFLDPGEFCLAHTIEKFNLPDNISAEFKLKSSIARQGLNQLTAVWCDPGWNGSALTLELSNVTKYHRLHLTVGMPIGQMIFHQHAFVPDEASYRAKGRYNHDAGVSGVKP